MFEYRSFLLPIDRNLFTEEETTLLLESTINLHTSGFNAEVVSVLQSEKFYNILYRRLVEPDKEQEFRDQVKERYLRFIDESARKHGVPNNIREVLIELNNILFS